MKNHNLHGYKFVNRINITKLVMTLLLGASLVGCVSSGGTLQYYLLHSTSSQATSETSSSLLINKIILPDYLKQRGLVYQTSSTNLHIATEHLWAEPLDEGITKALKGALRSKGVTLLTHNVDAQNVQDYLTLQIDDFIATWQGDIVFSGQYTLKHLDEAQSAIHFDYTFPLENDGFPASIEVMREAITALATDIASDVNQMQE
ncbi:ABC-type transport auxiliary lipoprotein family protein [Alteromonas sp. 1_MG-2023]|uniref:PqiC family protein n=1 Tax=Alteromonas sp. 1_MG-2023 TaxID=3062669 RepID=UPI0026E3EA86|nr:ABC-type transport auxiliary lipoprotein family protein [Alteromonas sp. 1_MG-2023]MDO6568889.1 ABC-type transport auxiliary lipoprotein family protein [Alteromonas sp. 1_MG-2023]